MQKARNIGLVMQKARNIGLVMQKARIFLKIDLSLGETVVG